MVGPGNYQDIKMVGAVKNRFPKIPVQNLHRIIFSLQGFSLHNSGEREEVRNISLKNLILQSLTIWGVEENSVTLPEETQTKENGLNFVLCLL